MCASIHERVASAINVEIADLKHKDPCAKIPPLIQAKATDLDTLTYLMKVMKRSRKQAAEFFDVSQYGIPGKTLPEDIRTLVVNFFEDDEFSRLMPGKKDYVSISKNVHKRDDYFFAT